MSSDEEYLDELLKSIMEKEDEANHSGAENESDPEELIEGNEEGMPADTDLAVEDDFFLNDFAIQEPDIDDIDSVDINLEEEEEEGEGVDSSDISDILSSDEIDSMFMGVEEAAGEEEDFADNSETADDSLAEIDALLQSDNDDMAADDMLAILESMSSDMNDEADMKEKDLEKEASEGTESAALDVLAEMKAEGGKKKGIFSHLFGKKKKKEEEKPESEDEYDAINSKVKKVSDEEETADQDAVIKEESVKKQGFFARLFSFLTESDEEQDVAEKLKAEHGMELSDENRNILQELDAEDKKKKKKKAKGKKDEESEDGASEPKKEKENKKKEKKIKPVREAAAVTVKSAKPVKKVSGKNIAIITALCLTLAALIIVIVSIVPSFFEKRKAREAYYEADYEQSYELLYGKKLDESDTIIFNKSKIILSLNRKLSSYHNYMSMGKELEALDALMSGVEMYSDIITEAEEYNATQEVDAVYATILNILSDKYSLSEEVAKVIIGYDDLTYTRKLESIIYKTPFLLPEEEDEQEQEAESSTMAAADILPEEQDIIEENALPAETSERQVALEVEPENVTNDISQEQSEEALQDESAQNTEDFVPGSSSVEAPVQNTESTGSQGQLIQGVRQPVDIKINRN